MTKFDLEKVMRCYYWFNMLSEERQRKYIEHIKQAIKEKKKRQSIEESETVES